MFRKLTSETLERRTVFSANPIAGLNGDPSSFMDYTDDCVLAVTTSDASVATKSGTAAPIAGDGFGLLPYLEQESLHKAVFASPVESKRSDAVWEQVGCDPQGIIAILIGLYAPRPSAHSAATQRVELDNAAIHVPPLDAGSQLELFQVANGSPVARG